MTNVGVVELCKNGVIFVIDGHQVGSVEIPSDYVPITFNPVLGHHALISGDQLQDGFIVVLSDISMRHDPDSLSPENPDRKRGFIPTATVRENVQRTARWALVTNLEKRGDLISFTAIYSDGTMRDRTYNRAYKWAVLLEYKFYECVPKVPFAIVNNYLFGLNAADKMFYGETFDEFETRTWLRDTVEMLLDEAGLKMPEGKTFDKALFDIVRNLKNPSSNS